MEREAKRGNENEAFNESQIIHTKNPKMFETHSLSRKA